jgi:hypothetical protein
MCFYVLLVGRLFRCGDGQKWRVDNHQSGHDDLGEKAIEGNCKADPDGEELQDGCADA